MNIKLYTHSTGPQNKMSKCFEIKIYHSIYWDFLVSFSLCWVWSVSYPLKQN